MSSITINIRMSTAARFAVTAARPSSTILQLKVMICHHESSGDCPVDRQRLIYKGRILSENGKTLQEYGITGEAGREETIHLVKGSAPRNDNDGNGAGTAQTMNQQLQPPNPFGFNPSAPQGQGSGNGSGINEMMNNMGNMDMSEMQNQLMQNPEMMQSMMDSPMMQSIMNNPDFLRSMMENNPQMRQLLESNPELRHVLDDPEMMRRSMEMMRDPSAMQNAMRNQDLALSQIENIPGGFNALRRMYEDVQAPMMDAMASGNSGDSASGNTTRSSENQRSGAAGTAMPNPWASSNSTTSNTNANPTGNSTSAPNMNSMNNPFAAMANANANANSNPWGMPPPQGQGNNNSMGGMPAGMPGMPGMPNNMNMEQTIEMLENPMMNQMMSNLMSDPAMMQNMINSNPMLRQLTESNPQVAAMMSNPEMMRNMLNPSNLRNMMQMQNSMGGMPGFPAIPGMGSMGNMGMEGSMGSGNGANNSASGLDFSSLLLNGADTGMGGGAGFGLQPVPATNAAPIPPEQRFRAQLQSLNDMGFDDNQVNIPALIQTHGNVNRAIDMLLTNPPAPAVATSSVPPAFAATPTSLSASTTQSPAPTTHEAEAEVENAKEKDSTEKKND
uniref:Ubiquilin n=1 Tax=Chaetoceros debilis TaxID=122233 RepID=A0A7S3VGM9_9STRA|mmetsp:Transcript_23997/g.36573  ORF Transcript_23997/g.36573 Transcript_23997/m.36573 type:complete len:615 (+) Transcript_23997:199-2043(+)